MLARRQYAAISPIWAWNAGDLTLSGNLRITDIPESEKPKFSGWHEALTGREIKALSDSPSWFRYDFQEEPLTTSEVRMEAMESVRNAMLAYQLSRPVGTGDTDVFVILCETQPHSLVIGSFGRFQALTTTMWGRTLIPEPVDVSALAIAVAGVQQAFAKKITRLQNPLYLLELGEQATNLHIRLLLWVAALDMLLMAGGKSELFDQRLCNLLGRTTRVFPPARWIAQPRYILDDVAHDLYELRNLIAHGSAISERFRREVGFEDMEGRLIDGYSSAYQYRQVLEESALFLLCSALGTIFTQGLTDAVADPKRWRAHLDRKTPC